jgi:hypothetical protein
MFAAFSERLTPEIKHDLERALEEVVTQYDTRNYENRFVAGGAAEILLACAIRATGTPVDSSGGTTVGSDLTVYAMRFKEAFSVKASFSGYSSIRLVNVQGASRGATWSRPTIFMLPGTGLVYADPGHAEIAGSVVRTGDALVISRGAVEEHARAHPDLVVSLRVPSNPGTGRKVASVEIVSAMLAQGRYPHLSAHNEPEPAPTAGRRVAHELRELAELYQAGSLTETEFTAAKRRVLNPGEAST